MHWGMEGEHMGWMGLWWILGAVLIAALVWALLKSTRGPMNGRSDSPEEILKRRYAKGEIDRETYQRMLTDLKG
jgi:putative membrane protein